MAKVLTQVSLDRLNVTSGPVKEATPRLLTVTDPIIRAEMRSGRDQTACVQFRFRGPTRTLTPSASGEILEQIGLKLRSLNPCNLIYAMWRTRPAKEIVLQIKRNPGKTTSAQCGGAGYTTIGRVAHDEPFYGHMHELMAEVRTLADGDVDVIVWADWKEVLRKRIDPALLDGIDGPPGFRTDNGIFDFRFYTAE